MAFIVFTLSIAIAVLGAVGIFAPTALLAVSRPFLTRVTTPQPRSVSLSERR